MPRLEMTGQKVIKTDETRHRIDSATDKTRWQIGNFYNDKQNRLSRIVQPFKQNLFDFEFWRELQSSFAESQPPFSTLMRKRFGINLLLIFKKLINKLPNPFNSSTFKLKRL